jgi:hypothetical protein
MAMYCAVRRAIHKRKTASATNPSRQRKMKSGEDAKVSAG